MLQYGMRLQYNNVTVLQCYNVTMLILLLCYFPPFSKCVTKCITLCYTTPNTIGCVECNLPWARLHSQAIPPPHHYHCTPHNHRHNHPPPTITTTTTSIYHAMFCCGMSLMSKQVLCYLKAESNPYHTTTHQPPSPHHHPPSPPQPPPAPTHPL